MFNLVNNFRIYNHVGVAGQTLTADLGSTTRMVGLSSSE